MSLLNVEVAKSYEAMSERAADLILAELKRRPDLLLCLSAGATPTDTYKLLAKHGGRQPGLFRKLRLLKVDEWGGLSPNSPASCEGDLRLKLLKPLRFGPARCEGFRPDAANPRHECERITKWLADNGPIDICILGLGRNGHIAMNEPSHALLPHAHEARLTDSSLKHPMLKALKRKPRFGFTLGMAEILRSRKILLLVNGQHKRAVLKRLLEPRITTRFPASFLWLHPDATVLCDRDAASDFKSLGTPSELSSVL